jgi:hypothetical protein
VQVRLSTADWRTGRYRPINWTKSRWLCQRLAALDPTVVAHYKRMLNLSIKLGHLPVGSLHTCEAHTPELVALHQVLSSFLGALAAQLRTLPDAVGAPLSEPRWVYLNCRKKK